jgi:glycerol-3-phosphate acyltransferase PlsY
MACDIFKGFLAVKIGSSFGENSLFSPTTTGIICGLLVICGHIWTIFHSFKGGKGVNTATGVLIGLMPFETLCAVIIFVIVLLTTGYVSLGSIISSTSLPLILIIRNQFFNYPLSIELLIFVGILPVLIILTHRGNIKRLLNGTENKVKLKKK